MKLENLDSHTRLAYIGGLIHLTSILLTISFYQLSPVKPNVNNFFNISSILVTISTIYVIIGKWDITKFIGMILIGISSTVFWLARIYTLFEASSSFFIFDVFMLELSLGYLVLLSVMLINKFKPNLQEQ